ncbi:MAG TPA: class I SAM-dependent methyltransferase [Acidimicrobiia bacterium]|nr:class I SAM-dependent methyltransferase [Acidimicrobiia bacterium]
MGSAPNDTARRLFAPIAPDYQRWARVLSLGQDGRWRRAMVNGLTSGPGSLVLDVAAGTGSITRLVQRQGHRVIAVDLSPEMLTQHAGPERVLARAERVPFPDETFDAVTFGYLLRYVEDPVECLAELARVLRPGGVLGMVEFGLPGGVWYPAWRLYAGALLPLWGRLIDPGWHQVGLFLRASIEDFHRRHPDPIRMWEEAGLADVRARRLTRGCGLVMWGRRP